jgi:DNA-binding transcriptional MerR regulator
VSGYTVKQVAKLSGVSVRTLHHYDEIGLLKPACVGANGYRYYGREELLRLQQILFHRELGFSLEETGRMLDAGGFDRVAALKAHRTKLEAERKRYGKLIRTIDETLAALEGERTMDDKAMYKGFSPEKQAEYEAWFVGRMGEAGRRSIEQSKAAKGDWTQGDYDRSQAEWAGILSGYAELLTGGLPADADAAQRVARRHWDWLAQAWGKPVTPQGFLGLAALYGEHPDFTAAFDARGVGVTEYMQTAMRAFADRNDG